MGRVIAWPMRLDSAGAVVTISDSSPAAAAAVAAVALSTLPGERPLAPAYGLPEVSPAMVAGSVETCEPDLIVTRVEIGEPSAGRVPVAVDVEWRA